MHGHKKNHLEPEVRSITNSMNKKETHITPTQTRTLTNPSTRIFHEARGSLIAETDEKSCGGLN